MTVKQFLPSFFLLFFVAGFAMAQSYEDYDWKNVPIGGGGYITGMQIHPLNGERRYYRTDVGGAYRWNTNTQRMEQIVFSTNKNHYSVAGIALHPINENIVYLGVGRNCNSSDTAILKSTDGGVNFSVVQINGGVQFHFAANGGRDCDVNDPMSPNFDTNGANNGDKDRQGTPLAINPLNTNELYIGTREKGLWVLNLTTLNATQVATIPTNPDQYSIRSVVFNPTLHYVYVAYSGHGIYVGNTNTKTFVNVDPGGNLYPELLYATDISISRDANYMMVACKREGIMKASGINTPNQNISWTPMAGGLYQVGDVLPDDNDNAGYYTVDCSPHDNQVAVGVTGDWNHINEFQVTTDGGTSWNQVSGSVDMAKHIFKWRDDAFASHVSQIAFDPVNANLMHYTSWFSTFSSDNWSPTNGGQWHSERAEGHEEIVGTDLVAFPINNAGNFLMAGSGDHSGFVFDNDIETIDKFPNNHIQELCSQADQQSLGADGIKKNASFDFCEKQTQNLAVVLTDEWSATKGALLTSTDGGSSWQRKNGYQLNYKKTNVAIAANDPNNIVILSDRVRFSTNGGNTVFSNAQSSNVYSNDCNLPFNGAPIGPSNVSSIPTFNNSVFGGGRYLTADKELSCVFYFYSPDGSFNISSDGGENWGRISDDQLPATTNLWNKTRLISIPGNPGHLFINVNNKLYKTTTGGRIWTPQTSVDQARALSFGAGFGAYPAIYIFGRLNPGDDNHIYRSDDGGTSWVRINEHNEKELWGDNKFLAGDRNVPGRVYSTVSGQGVIFGEKAGTQVCNNSELTIDGNFDASNSPNVPNWAFYTGGGAVATASINPWTKALIDISTPGTFDYDIQLWQDNLGMEAGKKYVVKTDLRADADRPVTVKLRNQANGSIIYLDTEVMVSSTSQEYAFVFEAPVSDNNMRLTLMMGTDANNVYIDYVSFKEYCDDPALNDIDCVDYMWLNDHPISAQTYRSHILIESNGQTQSGAQTIMKAGSYILLTEDFLAPQGTHYEAIIEDCP